MVRRAAVSADPFGEHRQRIGHIVHIARDSGLGKRQENRKGGAERVGGVQVPTSDHAVGGFDYFLDEKRAAAPPEQDVFLGRRPDAEERRLARIPTEHAAAVDDHGGGVHGNADQHFRHVGPGR